MGKGYDQNQERLAELNRFGKELARRAKSKCELTGESGVKLVTYEIPPTQNSPRFESCLMISERTQETLAKPQKIHPHDWHHLNELIWSEIPAVQIMAYRLLSYLGKTEKWAADLIEEAYLDEEILSLAEKELL